MLIKELLEDAKKLGRTFNHLEDLIFFHGTEGIKEVIKHINDLSTPAGAASLRMKWDGCVHEDTIVLTSQGDLSIKELVDKIDLGETVKVLGRNLESHIPVDIITNVIAGQVTQGIKDWVEIELENGSILKMTEDHEVHTSNRGWVPAGQLTPDDDITQL